MVELKLDVKKQDIRAFEDVFNEAKSRDLAEQNKKKAFGMLSVFDKAENIELTHSEKRYEPFWHIIGESFIEYFRTTAYGFQVEPQVREVKISDKVIEINGEKPYCSFEAQDRCVENFKKELITDAVEGTQKESELRKYLDEEKFKTRSIKETEALMGENKVVMPAKIKASYLVRGFVKDLIKPVHADKIINEKVEIKKTALYFRPIYAFEFSNRKSNKSGVIEIDALTGEITKGKVYKTSMKELIPEGALFDIGAELASTLIPGVSLGAEIGKAIKKSRDEKKAIRKMKESRAFDDALKEKKKR